jgi:hypothetical protein
VLRDRRRASASLRSAAMSYGKQYKDIWTKDPHGGAYRRVSAGLRRPGGGCASWRAHALRLAAQAGDTNAGYDALTQRPDKSLIKLEPGARARASRRGRQRGADATRVRFQATRSPSLGQPATLWETT